MTAATAAAPRPVLVLGIGNILMRDDGVGPRAAEALSDLDVPDHVEVLDGGTSGIDLVDLIAGRTKLVVIDAMAGDAEPGTVVRLRPDELTAPGAPGASLHDLGIVETLRVAEHLGCAPEKVVIVGVQPAEVTLGLELTPEVQAAIPRVVEVVLEEVAP